MQVFCQIVCQNMGKKFDNIIACHLCLTFLFAQYWFYFVCLQSVEEAECHRAYDSATDVYMSSFDRSSPPEEVSNPICLKQMMIIILFLSNCNACRLL